MPNWSLPALEAARCVARQGDEPFERVHPRLYEAYFTRSLNIADPRVVADIVAAEGVDMTRFHADLESGAGREAVVKDYEAAVAEGVRSIPTVIVPQTGRVLVGLVDAAMYELEVQLTTVLPGRSPCLACLYPAPPLGWQREFPVFGAVAGMIGSLGAIEVIKVVAGLGAPLTGQMLLCDLRSMSFRKLPLRRDEKCRVCSTV